MTCLVGFATALVVSTSGCDPYTYYNIHIALQESGSNNDVKIPNTLNQIASCDLAVYASDRSEAIEPSIGLNQRTLGPHASPCRGTETPLDLGILDYSTARSSGSLSFRVNIRDANRYIIIQGMTDPVAVSPGHILPTVDLTASPCIDPDPKNPVKTNPDQPNAPACK
jgi:hypothetical protein